MEIRPITYHRTSLRCRHCGAYEVKWFLMAGDRYALVCWSCLQVEWEPVWSWLGHTRPPPPSKLI